MGVKCGLCGVLSIGMLLCLLMFGWCFMCGGWSFLELLQVDVLCCLNVCVLVDVCLISWVMMIEFCWVMLDEWMRGQYWWEMEVVMNVWFCVMLNYVGVMLYLWIMGVCMILNDRKIWFLVKCYGWGWGLLVVWQGWVVLLLFVFGIVVSVWLLLL